MDSDEGGMTLIWLCYGGGIREKRPFFMTAWLKKGFSLFAGRVNTAACTEGSLVF